jgi:hypothetical protein
LAAATIPFALVSAAAFAQGKQDFTLVNRTGYTISEVYVSPTRADSWEEDVMGRDVLSNGAYVQIRFGKRENICLYDLLIVFDDQEEAEWNKLNLCQVSRITLFYNRKTGETTAEYE